MAAAAITTALIITAQEAVIKNYFNILCRGCLKILNSLFLLATSTLPVLNDMAECSASLCCVK